MKSIELDYLEQNVLVSMLRTKVGDIEHILETMEGQLTDASVSEYQQDIEVLKGIIEKARGGK